MAHCREAVWSAVLATAWLLVVISLTRFIVFSSPQFLTIMTLRLFYEKFLNEKLVDLNHLMAVTGKSNETSD